LEQIMHARAARLLLTLVLSAALGDAARPLSAAEPAARPAPAGVLRVLFVPDDRSDFFSAEGGAKPGFEREMLDGFARARNLRLEAVPVTGWEDIVPALEAGKGDVIAGHCTVTEQRQQHVDFTDPVLPTRNVVMTRKPAPRILLVKDLVKKRIGGVKGSASYAALLEAGVPKANVEEAVSQQELLERLRAGKIDAIVRPAPLAIVTHRDEPSIELGMFIGPPSHFAWGVAKKNTELRTALNEHLTMMRRTGAWTRLVARYFGESSIAILKQAQE
jgi:ABC-type amino acid transport substrate-binding protein